MINANLILNTDSYKTSHWLQYPEGTEIVSSYIECRGGLFPESLFFGLQMFLQEYLLEPITEANIHQAKAVLTQHGVPFNEAGWRYILEKHQGYLPLRIEAVPEGTLVPNNNVMLQVENTDPACYWLTTYVETALLRAVWYPTTVATLSWQNKKLLRRYLLDTADELSNLSFMLHDFGARGVSSFESAAIGGLAHLVNFQGTDTLSAVLAAEKYYQEPMAAFSIPATEHATITAWGQTRERQAYENALKQFQDYTAVSVVSDSYDIFHAVDVIWGQELHELVTSSKATLVIRPDSGDPVTVVSQVIEKLMTHFGAVKNSKGYRVLPKCVRVIQGDTVTLEIIEQVLEKLKQQKISAENLVFGMGGALLQKINRDTQQFAMKCSAIKCQGQWQDVFKSPQTNLIKQSKPGRLALVEDSSGTLKTVRLEQCQQKNILQPVFENGKLLRQDNLKAIRQRADRALEIN